MSRSAEPKQWRTPICGFCTIPRRKRLPRAAILGPATLAFWRAIAGDFPELPMVGVDDVFGGWAEAHRVHFSEGGVFDQISAEGRQ